MVNVILREIKGCTASQIKAVRNVRNQQSIRHSMYNEHEISLSEHLAWIKKIENDPKRIVFVVLINDEVSGVVSVDAIDYLHLKSDWAFYLDETARGGLGAALEYNLISFVFNTLRLEKLNCEVISTNELVVKLHKKFGFLEEGFRRENVIKNGVRIGVHFLGITKSDWEACKEVVFDRYEKAISKFNITIEYTNDEV